MVFLTLLSFSPSWCGNNVRKLWKPAFILCIRLLSFEFAISLRNLRSWSWSPPEIVKSLQWKNFTVLNIWRHVRKCQIPRQRIGFIWRNLSEIDDNLPAFVLVYHFGRVDVKIRPNLSVKFGAFLRRPRRKLLLLFREASLSL